MTHTGTQYAASPSDSDRVAFADLPIFSAATDAAIEADVLAGAIGELRDRLLIGRLDRKARTEIADDLMASARALVDFALAVRL